MGNREFNNYSDINNSNIKSEKSKKSKKSSRFIALIASTVALTLAFSSCASLLTKYTVKLENDFKDIYNNPLETGNDSADTIQGSDQSSGVVFDDASTSGFGGFDGSNIQIFKPDAQYSDQKLTSAGQAYSTVSEVYYAIADSVVEIRTETVQNSFWMGEYVSTGAGSGVIIDKSGIIVTNHHVIEGANNVTVTLTDGSEFEAKLIGSDDAGDLAVIKIEPGDKQLTVASLGCSADIKVGEDVVALGNPLGSLGGTLSEGIISATERIITIDGTEMILLQTTAAINPGNSGGGLFNMAGQLIGIVNAKAAGEDIEGIGFAIPIDTAHKIIEDIIKYGYVRGIVDHGLIMLDVTAQNLPSAYRKYGITTTGVIILDSEFTDSLKYGDKIIAVEGVEVLSSSQLDDLLRGYSIGDEVKISVVRGAEVVEAVLVLQEKVPDKVNFN